MKARFYLMLLSIRQLLVRVCKGSINPISELHHILNYKKKYRTKGNKILITCFPKSGSTFLSKSLQGITGYPHISLLYTTDKTEQEIYFPELINYYDRDAIIQQHTRATEATIKDIVDFSIPTIVLVRNIFDIVISFRDHLVRESVIVPMAYIDENFLEMNDEEQFDFVIDLVLPWYFNFFVSWQSVLKMGTPEIYLLSYEHLMSNKQQVIKEILEFSKVSFDEGFIDEKLQEIDLAKVRLNKGVKGRGLDFLTESQINKVKEYKKHYPNVDFSIIGL